MATKRPHPSVHPSRTAQVPVEASEPSRKRRKPNLKANTPGAKTFKKAHPVNELKSRVRSLKRQLERNDSLSAVEQQEKERALRHAEEELARNERAKKRSAKGRETSGRTRMRHWTMISSQLSTAQNAPAGWLGTVLSLGVRGTVRRAVMKRKTVRTRCSRRRRRGRR